MVESVNDKKENVLETIHETGNEEDLEGADQKSSRTSRKVDQKSIQAIEALR